MKKIRLGTRTWILIFFLIFSLISISPSFEKGVLIKSVEKDSQESMSGLTSGVVIKEINGNQINNLKDYLSAIDEINFDGEFQRIEIKTKSNNFVIFTNESIKLTVSEIPRYNLKLGLDLQGGARALVRPENVSLSFSELNDLISVTNERLNVYGITDISLKPVTDLEGNNFMLIEIAGASPSELEELVGKQGKFEAKIGEDIVFIGGNKDITYVCRNDASCSGIQSCEEYSEGHFCKFQFSITLTEEAAKRHADITSLLNSNITESGERYLDKKLDLFVDDKLTDSLLISESLKGKITTQIAVSGSGTGATREEAIKNTRTSMNKLQTILITGSLPYKIEIVKIDTISPALSSKFLQYLIYAAVISLLAVALVVFLRYRKIKISLAILLTSFSEIFIILGFAAFLKWNLDLSSIAAILTTIGTGVDQQIIVVDETRTKNEISMPQRIKRALFIMFGVYFTAVASLLPLYWVGAGLLRGFAFTTILGATIGMAITRPAFAEIISRIEK
jgi:preprotein translocase subunit SecD